MSDNGPRLTSLTVQGGPLDGLRVSVTAADEVLVGSDPGCGLHVDLPGVSPIHARVVAAGGEARVKDARSPHGLFVGGTRVEGEATLRPGDVLWLGPPQAGGSIAVRCDFGDEEPLIVADVAEVEPIMEETVVLEEAPSAAPAGEDFFIEEAGPAPGSSPFAQPPPPGAAEPTAGEEVFFVDTSAPSPPPPGQASEDAPFFFDEAPTTALPEPLATPEPADILPPAEERSFLAPAPPPEPVPPPAAPAPPFAPSPPAPPPARAAAPVVAGPPEPDVYVAEVVEPQAPKAPPPAAPPPRRTEPVLPRVDAPTPRRTTGSYPRQGAAPRPSPRPRAKKGAPIVRYVGLGVLGLAILGGGALLSRRLLGGPRVGTVDPVRARMGQTVIISGTGLAPEPEVLFGERPATIQAASDARLEVTVPDIPGPPNQDMRLPLRVKVGGRETGPIEVTVYQGPTIHGISPDVAMPGEDVVLQGTGWGMGASVKFGSVPAEVLNANDTMIRVRVPPLDGKPGTSAPVVVSVGGADSNPGPFVLGRIPLVFSVEPRTASPGDVVTVTGRGFRREGGQNDVRIGGVRALVAAASDSDLKTVVPRVPPGEGERPLDVRVAGSDGVGHLTLTIAPPPEAVDFHFVAEPFEPAGRGHAVLATALGPAFVLAASGGRSAAERAVDAARRLNEAAGSLKASRSQDVEVRDITSRPVLGLTGRSDAILEVTDEDAAAYNESPAGPRGRGGMATKYRLARWWEAVARDLVLLLVRGEPPRHAAGLAAEGKVFGDVFQAAQRTGRFGVPYSVVSEMKPATRDALRTVGLRLPASVKTPEGAPEPTVAAAASGPVPLTLEGTWTGSEIEGSIRRWLTLKFRPSGASISYEGTVTLTVPLLTLEQPQKGTVSFSVQYRGGIRYYAGKWDGESLTGTFAADEAGTQPVGTFELRPR